MKSVSRILALTLCFVMLIVYLPSSVLAEISEVVSEEIVEDEIGVGENDFQENEEIIGNTAEQIENADLAELTVLGEADELRTETTKIFRMSDGSFVAVDYGKTVHFPDENGNWTDYDNTLSASDAADSEDFSGYETKKSNVSFKLANNSNSSNLLKITKDGYKISLHLVGADKSKAVEIYESLEKLQGDDIESASTLTKFSSGAIYKEIFWQNQFRYSGCRRGFQIPL